MSAVQNGVDAVVVVESEHEIVPYRVRKALAVDRRKKIKTIQGKKSIFLKARLFSSPKVGFGLTFGCRFFLGRRLTFGFGCRFLLGRRLTF